MLGYRLFLWTLFFLSLSLLSCSGEGKPCQADEECSFGTHCEGGVCKAGCRFSIECPKGEVCKQNLCVRVLQDGDQDGYPVPLDCDDADPNLNPGVQEICGNNKDDNCNGKIDETPCIKVECQPGSARDCYDGKEQTLTFPGTLCKKGRQFCNSTGVWSDCQGQILPSAERCDGEDNDCDGSIDEGEGGKSLTQPCFSGPQEARSKGICVEGLQTCEQGRWRSCQGEILPAPEVCDGEDNDCDGIIDNLTGTGTPCQTGEKGECGSGERRCDLKQKQVVCVALHVQQAEVCGDGKDNDCDGKVDNGCPYTPVKIADVASHPHYLFASEDRLLVSLRDTRMLGLFDTSALEPKALPSIRLSETPHGVVLHEKTAYIATETSLLSADITQGQAETLTTFPFPSHAGSLLFFGGRLYTRFSGTPQGSASPKAGLCKTEIATKQVACADLNPVPSLLAPSLERFSLYLLLLTEQAVHWFDTVLFAEEPQKAIKLQSGYQALALDDRTSRLVALHPTQGEILIIDTLQGRVSSPLRIVDDQGKPVLPGAVAASGGMAYVGHRTGNLVSEIDLLQEKEVQRFRVGIGVTALTFGPYRLDQSRLLFIASSADNTLWQITIPGPAPKP